MFKLLTNLIVIHWSQVRCFSDVPVRRQLNAHCSVSMFVSMSTFKSKSFMTHVPITASIILFISPSIFACLSASSKLNIEFSAFYYPHGLVIKFVHSETYIGCLPAYVKFTTLLYFAIKSRRTVSGWRLVFTTHLLLLSYSMFWMNVNNSDVGFS